MPAAEKTAAERPTARKPAAQKTGKNAVMVTGTYGSRY